ncbi:hypothetical protein [Edaphobacter aggregans]|uniref:hypothetical protein n=1 Tax=Edaphobacter aggregans TaxID=570835 RepID=UPI0005583DA9|nr:hypothetical protein [Edaphobacter aggregans]
MCYRRMMIVAVMLAASTLQAAEKLKGVYSGSGGLTAEVHRVVMVEFAEDGTAIIQQNWTGKDSQVWHARWTQDGKKLTITFDAVKDKPAIEPLLCDLKRGTLVPTSWDAKVLGVMGPPQLTPFGGKNVQQHSVATCQSLNSGNPSHNCVTWDSRAK